MYRKSVISIILSVISALLLSSCGIKNAEPITQTHFYFDSAVSFTVYNQKDLDALDQCRDICEQVHNMTDRFNAESEISALNKEKNALLSDELSALLTDIKKYSEGTGFTPCIAPFMDLWGFSTDNPKVPSENEISNLLSKNYGFTISEDKKSVILTDDTTLDLGGAAKGFAGDKIIACLKESGVSSALISLGSSTMIMYGTKPDGKEFNIGLQKPWAETGMWEYSFKGSDIAMSVSGPYERYFEENGTIYHHILDPATGRPADTELNGACIIGKNALQTDILSTAVFLMGADRGLEYIENIKGVECILFDKDNKIILSSGLTLNDKTVSLKLNTAGF